MEQFTSNVLFQRRKRSQHAYRFATSLNVWVPHQLEPNIDAHTNLPVNDDNDDNNHDDDNDDNNHDDDNDDNNYNDNNNNHNNENHEKDN